MTLPMGFPLRNVDIALQRVSKQRLPRLIASEDAMTSLSASACAFHRRRNR